MASRRFVTPMFLVLIVLLVSCLQGAKAPKVSAGRTLDLGGPESGDAKSKRPFAVVFAGPLGKTDEPSEVTIVFNRPMRPLELASDTTETAPPASIVLKGTTAQPRGAWRWMGTSALMFEPNPALARATEYVVTVPVGTKALDGSTLSEAYTFSFSTPTPKLVRVDPREGDDHLVPSSTFELRFNQPVDPREVERAAKIYLGQGVAAKVDLSKNKETRKTASFRASWPKADTKTLIKVTPSQPFPLDTRIELTIDRTLHGMEGPLPTGEERSVGGSTYGPISVSGVECSTGTPHRKCAAHGYLSITFSNGVAYKDLKSHVSIEGVPIDWSTSRGENDKAQYASLNAKVKPAKSYAVVVTAGLKDEYGQTLTKNVRLPFETDDEWPSLAIGVAGTIFEAPVDGKGKARDVPIGAMNVSQYELVTASLDEASLAQLELQSNRSARDHYAAAKATPNVKVESVRPGAAANTTAVKMLHLDQLLADRKGHGAALVAVRHESTPGRPFVDVRTIAMTDLAISAKMSRFGSLVWVTHLSNGAPATGATVAVRTLEGETFATKADANGIAIIPSDKYMPADDWGTEDAHAILVARAGNDWTWRRVNDALSTWQYEPSSDISGRLTPMGMLFTDRGIYKTGETIQVKGLFRVPLPRGTGTPKGRKVSLVAYDSNGTKFFEQEAKLGAFGEVASEVAIPASTRLGTVELRAEIAAGDDKGAQAGAATATVQLATYRPAEFKSSVETNKASYVRGEKAAFTVHGDYLFGAPMSGGNVRFTITRGNGYFQPPNSEGLIFDDSAYSWGEADSSPRAGELQSGEGTLDAKGTFGGTTALVMPHQHGAEVVSIEAEVEDVSRQTIAGRSSVIVHPGEFYVGMVPPEDMFVDKGANLRPQVAAIEPSGRRRAGVPVHVELVKRTWETVVEADGELGHYSSKTLDTIVGTCDAKTTTALATCDLTANEAGYFILRASAKDPRGNVVAASTSIYELGGRESIGWAMNDGSKLELVTDKKSYEVGDVAKILIKSPFRDADALVTVERAGVYTQERMSLSGSMPTIRIPVTDDLRPNAFVSVHLVRGRTQAAPAKGHDVGAPAFRLGYAEISVNPEARRLKVAIASSKKDYRPSEEVDADITVTDRAGKAAKGEVTFYAVDEGVLMLTGYKTPDPIPTFTSPRPLNVFAIESREDLARVLFTANGVGTDKGDEGGGGGSVREDFRSTAYFAPSVTTDDRGHAHVHFKLPDSLTTYRLMAVVASADDRFGFGESQITASRMLMARPNLPRFMRAGDSIDAGVVLSSKNMPARNVEVTIEAQGVTVSGDAKRIVALPANGSVEVRWAIASPNSGSATFAFHAKAGDAKDDVKVTRDVEVPLNPEAVALYGETTNVSAEQLGNLSAMRTDTGGLDLRLSSTALIGLDDGIEQLIEYPYGCTEQLTSRLVPLLPLRALANDFHIALPKDLDGVIEKAVAKIVQNQRGDGGFGYWPGSPSSDAWVSAYALWGLDIAKKHGVYLPEGVLENVTRFVRGALEHQLRDGDLGRATMAFMLDVLATAGSPDTGYANRLYEDRAKMPLFARALLAHAMVVSKMDAKQAAELARDFENHLRVTPTGATVVENLGDEYAVVLDSEARTTAMVIRALIAIDPSHPLAGRLAKGLLGARKGGRWRSTQETAWSLLALDDYRHAQEKEVPQFDANVFMGDQLLFTAPFKERSATSTTASFGAAKLFEANASGATLAFQVQGSGKVFYEARLRYSKKEMPTTGLDRGFFVRKLVRSVRPEGLKDALGTLPQKSMQTAQGGDLVLVDLFVVTADPREQVVIDDPLPAGLEAVQANFATTSRSLDVTEPGAEGDTQDMEASDSDAIANDRAYSFAWYHREIHDDRVLTFVEHMPAGMYHYRYLARATTFGHFVVPPTRAECMYEPETFGRTGATTFDVGQAGR